MKVLIVGAGMVGSSIAASLADSHEVTVMDVDETLVEELTYEHDVLALHGDGTNLADLEEAGAAKADLLIASTDVDETNLAICGTVSTIGDPFTIARVKRVSYLTTWQQSEDVFDVDFMVCSDLLTAQSVARLIGFPTAIDVDPFAGGCVQMAEFEVPEGSPVAGQTVREADRYDDLTFVSVVENGSVEIATGDSRIPVGSRVVVIGIPQAVRSFAGVLTPGQANTADDVMIFGATSVGIMIAEFLEDRGLSPRMIESDPVRARQAAEQLPGTTVLEHDFTDREFLAQKEVGAADLVVAAIEGDETNLLVSLLAKHLGAPRAIAIVEEVDFLDAFETVGVDVAVNPREVTAEEITRFTREREAENVAILESDKAEVIELVVDEESVLVDRTIAESISDLPSAVVIGAIIRDGEPIQPRGDTVVEADDRVVVFVGAEDIDEALNLL